MKKSFIVCLTVLMIGCPAFAVTSDVSAEGRVHINNSSAVPFHIVPNASTPTGANNGEFFVDSNSMLFQYDSTRAKWLSVETTPLQFGYNGAASGAYLRFGGDVSILTSGARMPYNGTIVAVTAKNSTPAAITYTLQVNGAVSATTFVTSAAGILTATNLNVDFTAGDFLGIRSAAVANANPIIVLWVKWRS